MRWVAPGRVNLIGEHTDYNDGWVLPFAVSLGVTATVTPRSDRAVVVTSTSWPGQPVRFDELGLELGAAGGWAAYAAGAVWALRSTGLDVGGVDVHLDSTLPVGAGLSSSAAVECAVTGAVAEAFGVHLSADMLVQVAHAAEHDFVGVPVGVLDQSAVVRCVDGHALFLDTRTMTARQVPLPLGDLAIVVIDTRAPHRLVDGEYARRRAECARSATLLEVAALRDVTDLHAALDLLPEDVLRRRTRHIVTENERVHATVALLDAGDLGGVGPLLTASHVSLRDDFEVSCPELDLAVDAALACGALGARMIGGGFGGSAIALVAATGVAAVRKAVTESFAAAGFAPPSVFPVAPAPGAHSVTASG